MAREAISPEETLQAFSSFVAPEIADENIDLLRAALVIARTEYPALNEAKYIARVQTLAKRVAIESGLQSALSRIPEPVETVHAINKVMFEEEGFRGNREDYLDPRNSFLNDVFDRKLGIPISLSLIYMEVAKRVGLPLLGVGMPGHFLLKHYDEYANELLIDVFDGGRIVTSAACQRRLDEIYSGQMTLQPEHLAAVTRRQLLTRMLNNLRHIYMSARNFRKALTMVDLTLCMHPRSPEDIKQRAILRYNLKQFSAALQDFELYVKIAPEASDAEEIRQTALAIRRSMALLN
jgi:regulator of sirC expression with transglutaminase-like and TPR domain